MSKVTSNKSNKKVKRDDKSDSEDSADNLQPILSFIPGEEILVDVLLDYITRYVDNTADITSSHHPRDKTRHGFTVASTKTFNAIGLRDLIDDSRDWELEKQSRTFKRNPYRYAESDTARRRSRQGPSKGGTTRPARRQTRETSNPPENVRRDKLGGSGGVTTSAAPYGQYQTLPSRGESQQTPASYYQNPYQSSSRQQGQAGTYNVNYSSVNTTSYNASVPPNTNQYVSTSYSGVGAGAGSGSYSAISRTDYPTTSYQMMSPGRPDSPQPDPDTFDKEEKPRISQMQRQGSIAAPDDLSRSLGSQGRRQQTYDEAMRRQGYGR